MNHEEACRAYNVDEVIYTDEWAGSTIKGASGEPPLLVLRVIGCRGRDDYRPGDPNDVRQALILDQDEAAEIVTRLTTMLIQSGGADLLRDRLRAFKRELRAHEN